MISTKNLVTRIEDIPSYWVFQYYLNLQQKLIGQDLKIKSLFNPMEKTPSFCIYVDKSIMQYKFKDFSTGKSGSKIDLVMYLFNVNFGDAMQKIVSDYNKAMMNGDFEKITLEPETKWKIDYVRTRDWIQTDADFWLQFNIGSSLLQEYNVRPLEYYTMIREKEDSIETISFEKANTYGYFNKNQELIKIYQPFSTKRKFYNAQDYLQGFDQLKYKESYLVICSSLKDAICLRSFNYKLEVLAPASENSMIKPYIINNLKLKYKKIITLFDNDDAGKKAIEVYKEKYGINGVALPISKDISDAVKEHGFKKIHAELKPLLLQTIKQ
jgi:DNA primase